MSLHDQIQKQILQTCNTLGFQAKQEYSDKDWRADVFVSVNGINYAFEIQTTRQSLNRTLERQAKYKRDAVIGCWLFEKEPARLTEERQDLPLFQISDIEGQFRISLKERKSLPLDVFISDYLQNKIKFCQTMKLSKAEIRFVKEKCWKCGFDYHIYYISNLISPCNANTFPSEMLWASDKLAFKPEIIAKVNEHAISAKDKNLNIGKIKERYSKTVADSYASFGCPECDAIFGDWFLHELIMDTIYEEGIDGDCIVDKILIDGNFEKYLEQHIQHWCHPEQNNFCE